MYECKDLGKPINTCLSADTDINNKLITKAKDFLSKNYRNRFDLPPHLTYMICPFPEYNLEKVKINIDAYFKNKTPFVFNLSNLHYEPKNKFYSIPVIGENIRKLHEDLVHLFNKYRDGHIREKDVTRIKAGEREQEEIDLIRKYGYFRIFDRFTPHITVGNVETSEENIPQITQKLNDILKEIIGKSIIVDKVSVTFHTDSDVQTEMQKLWGKDYLLDNK